MEQVSRTRPHLVFERPTHNYFVGELFTVAMLPAIGGEFEVRLKSGTHGECEELLVENNVVRLKFRGSTPSSFLQARWRINSESTWSPWSVPLSFSVHPIGKDISALREYDHRISNAVEFGAEGVVTLVDPLSEPPASLGLSSSKWFSTAVYEGATPIFNEQPDYYQDPLAYLLGCLEKLREKGASFKTWHDVLDGKLSEDSFQVIVQFDVDGGPNSMSKIFDLLTKADIRATLMIHRAGPQWYPYEVFDESFDWIHEAESRDWAIGYHNNTLSRLVGLPREDLSQSELNQASELFAQDVQELRRKFAIRTYTHHGGNVYNSKVLPPQDLGIVGVDRGVSPDLWSSISSSFSDGGFISRPSTLSENVESMNSGIHFFRLHPFKYGNYSLPFDAPPRFQKDFHGIGLEGKPEVLDFQQSELAKEAKWLEQRRQSRARQHFSYIQTSKPISDNFAPLAKLSVPINELRERRSQKFLDLYPWVEGDPRVFWWRMIHAYAPKAGKILNVGALPVHQKDQNKYFLTEEVELLEIDIDSSRQPDFEMDITEAPEHFNNSFSAVFLFGLPYFSKPSEAISSCARITEEGGVGLFGFVSDTHPARGSIFHPAKRHLWRRELEPLEQIGFSKNLWAFDLVGIPELFQHWNRFRVEFMGHYWFVVAEK